MKTNKLQIFITAFQLALIIIMLFGFSNSSDKSISIGYNAKFVERDTNLALIYGDDTVRLTITRAGNNLILGSSSTQPSGSITADNFLGNNGISTFQTAWINSTVGVTEDFYVEGDALIAGYLKVRELIEDSEAGKPMCGVDSLGAITQTVTISTGRVISAVKSIIVVTPYEDIAGDLHVSNIVAGTSFDVSSDQAGDVGKKFSWLLINKE